MNTATGLPEGGGGRTSLPDPPHPDAPAVPGGAAWSSTLPVMLAIAWGLLLVWCSITLGRVGDLRARVDHDVRWLRDAEIYRRDLDSLIASAARTGGRSLADDATLAQARDLLGPRTLALLDRRPRSEEPDVESEGLWRESASALETDLLVLRERSGDPIAINATVTHSAELGMALSRTVVDVRGAVTDQLDGLGISWWTLDALAAVLLLSSGALLVLLVRSRQQQSQLRDHDLALQAKERRYRQMFEGNPTVQFLLDPADGSFVAANPAAATFYGYSVEEMRRMTIRDINPAPEEEILRALTEAMERNRVFEFRHRLHSGELRDVEVRTGPVEMDGRTLLYSIVTDVTELRGAFASLRASEARLGLLVERLPAVVWTTDRELRFTACLGGGLEILGLRPDEVVGRTVTEYLALDDPTSPSIAAHLAALEGRPGSYETGWSGRTYRCEIRPLRDAQDQVSGTIGLAMDITERRRAEERYQSIFENAVEGIFQVTPEGRTLAANPALVRMLGYASEEDMRTTLTDIAHQHYVQPGIRERLQERLHSDGVVRGFEYEAHRKGGGTVWLSENVRAVRAADGSVAYYEGTIEDITERRRAVEEMARLQRFYGEILDRLPASLTVLEPTGRVLFANPAAVRDAVRRRWVVGRTDAEYAEAVGIDPSVVAERALALNKCVEERRVVALEESVEMPGEAVRHFLRLHSPVQDGDGTVRMVLRYGIDVTEHRLLEENLRQSSKMEAVGRLAGGVAHDFNNILTVITGYCDLLLARLPEGDDRRLPALEVRAASERAAALTGQLLAFSRKQVIHPRDLRLSEAVVKAEALLRRLIGEDVELVVTAEPGGLIHIDEGQLTQILMNLAVNARDAMPRGGRLLIRTRPLDSAGAEGEEALPAGRWELLEVTDTGEGIPEDLMHRIFEPFFTTKTGGRGVGLGLATVHGIVESAGGIIRARSGPGKGTAFIIALPRAEGPVPDASAASPLKSSDPSRGEVILLAEDEDPIRNLVTACLRNAGYTVLAAPDGLAALGRAMEHPGHLDLLLSDVVMPRMGGGTLAARVREKFPDIRVLFMSGYTDDTLVHHGVSERDEGFLQKPFRPAELLKAVREVLDHRKSTKNGAKA